MALYILDTDTLTHYRRGHPKVMTRVLAHPAGDVVTSAITLEEQVAGWYLAAKSAKTPQELDFAYRRLIETVEFFHGFPIQPFAASAIARYQTLGKLKLNIGKKDLRIAAICLENDATVVTANVRDFSRVPGLKIEDWTV